MILYVLDTDTLTLFDAGQPAVLQQVAMHVPNELAITVLSVEEQLSGWYTQVRQAKQPDRLALAYRRLARTVTFLSRLQILLYEEPAMRRFDALRKQKLKIGRTDLRIAVTVLEHGAILVTRNARDFQQVPGLQIEDWSQ